MEEYNNNTSKTINVAIDQDGIAYLTNLGAKKADDDFLDLLEAFVNAASDVLHRQTVKGLIYESPIPDREPDYPKLYADIQAGTDKEKQAERVLTDWFALQKLAKPTVALSRGHSTGPRLASLLWADYRIATPESTVGFTELKQGLFPGLGSSTLAIRLLGVARAITLLFAGGTASATQAENAGIIDQVAPSLPIALEAAKQWIKAGGQVARQHEDLTSEEIAALVQAARLKSNTLIPAHQVFLDLVAQSHTLDLIGALRQENTSWFSLWHRPETISMVRTFQQHVNKAKAYLPEQPGEVSPLKIGIIGAGIMGAGIAYEAARAGMTVLLKDINQAMAINGKTYAEKIATKLVERSSLTASAQQELLDRIQPSAHAADLKDADLIIEAVFEDLSLKAAVTKESLPFLKPQGVFASNTTSLPITTLASFSPEPQNLIGMHFFSPVDRMPLVEIIRGKETSNETLNKTLAIAHRLQKVPIVVFDGPAFFTSRIFFNYLLEAICMLLEGIPAASIEQEARKAGFATSPLAVLDEVSLKLMLQVYDQLPELHSSQQRCYTYLQRLIDAGRTGRKDGKGFYDYATQGNQKVIWQDPNITQATHPSAAETIQKRLLHVMALDSYRCLEEGVLRDPADGDIGSVLGVGYAAHTGGVFGHIDQVGRQTFVQECQSFAGYGPQWQVPASLARLAAAQFSFYNDFHSNWHETDLVP